MYKIRFLSILLLLMVQSIVYGQDTKNFNSLDELWNEVKKHNTVLKANTIQSEIARLAYKTSLANVINPRIPATVNFIDNTKLQSTFIPAEFFGGQEGSFKQIQFGQQYNTMVALQPQFDLLNLSAVAQIKYAKINKNLTESKNLLNEYNLLEQLNSTYHNILSLKSQKLILQQNLAIAEKIKSLTDHKYHEGQIRKQEVNEAMVHIINIKDKIEQIGFNIDIQQAMLSLFVENSFQPELTQTLVPETFDSALTANDLTLEADTKHLEHALLQQDIKSLQYQYFPTISFISSFNWQNLSNTFFLSSDASSINYNHVGLKLTWEFPTVQRLSSIKNKQFQLETLSLAEQHAHTEASLQAEQLNLEYQKAIKQYDNFLQIIKLKEDTYQKCQQQYEENVLVLDKLLTAQNDLLNSQLNFIMALANISYTKNRILINNRY